MEPGSPASQHGEDESFSHRLEQPLVDRGDVENQKEGSGPLGVASRASINAAGETNENHLSYQNETLVQRSNLEGHLLHPIRACLALSFSFTLSLTAFNGLQNMQSSINVSHGLGVITLAVNYGIVFFAAPLAPTLIQVFGGKTLLLVSWIATGIFIAANFYPVFATLIPAAVLMGFTSSCVGTVSFMYTTIISDSYAAQKRLGPHELHGVLSIFNGVFYAFLEFTQVSGNLLSSSMLFFFSNSSSSLSSGENPSVDTSLCGANMCPSTPINSTAIAHPGVSTLYILYGAFLVCVVLSVLVTFIFVPRLPTSGLDIPQPCCQKFIACYRMLINFRCLLLIPLYMGQATVIMIVYTGFTKAFISCTLGVKWVGFIMMVYGASTAIFATAANFLARYFGRVVLMLTFIFIDTAVLLVLLLWTPGQTYTKAALFAIAALAGVSEGISQAQFNALISTVFRQTLAVSYVAYIMTKCLGFAVSLGVSSFACFADRLYLALTLYALGFVGYVATEVRVRRNRELLGPALNTSK